MACMTFVGKFTERNSLEDLSKDGRIILKWILQKWNGRLLTGFIWVRIVTIDRLLQMQ